MLAVILPASQDHAGGWFIRGSQSPAAAPAEAASTSPPAPPQGANAGTQTPTPAQMQKMADTQAGPLIREAQDESRQRRASAEHHGNIYYDAQQFPTAIDYYQRALKVQPANTGAAYRHGDRLLIPRRCRYRHRGISEIALFRTDQGQHAVQPGHRPVAGQDGYRQSGRHLAEICGY